MKKTDDQARQMMYNQNEKYKILVIGLSNSHMRLTTYQWPVNTIITYTLELT